MPDFTPPDDWNVCPCANEPAMIRLRDIMRLMQENRDGKIPHEKWWPIFCEKQAALAPGPLWELMMHFIEAKGWSEHGGGINASWLNASGERALQALEDADLESACA